MTTTLLVVAGAAVVTYLTRFGGLVLAGRQPPAWARAVLSYVPVAAFASLLAPDLATGGDDAAPRVLGAAVAAAVVLRFGRLWACVAVGMAVFWLTRWVL